MAQEIGHPAASGAGMPAPQNAFEQYADAVNRNRIVGEMLKFSKGEWLAGRDGDVVEEGTELVAGIDGLQVGWVKWLEMKPVEYLMGPVAQAFKPAKRSELGDDDSVLWERDDRTGQPRDPWQLSNSFILFDPESGQLFTFPTASKGGIGAVGKLAGIYGKHMRLNPNQLPVVALLSDSYKHPNKQFGKVFTPLLKVTGWVERGAFDEALEREATAAAVEEAEEAEPVASKPSPKNDYAAAKAGEPIAKRGRGRPRKEYQGEDVPF